MPRELSPAELIEVRYEDLCSDVHGTLGIILHSLDLETRLVSLPALSGNALEPELVLARGALPAHELAGISQIQADQLIRHGYPVA